MGKDRKTEIAIAKCKESVTTSKSAAVSARGIKRTQDIVDLSAALIDDLLTERINPAVGRAAATAMSNMISILELHLRYTPRLSNGDRLFGTGDDE